MNTRAFICLGANCAQPLAMLAKARDTLATLPECALAGASSIWLTEPQDLPDQPWFHNQVLALDVNAGITPAQLLRKLLEIETELGRKRNGPRFGPRVIDIDLLLFGYVTSDDPFCLLPHPRLARRAFALVPLLELAPEIEFNARKARDWLAGLVWRCEDNKIFQ